MMVNMLTDAESAVSSGRASPLRHSLSGCIVIVILGCLGSAGGE